MPRDHTRRRRLHRVPVGDVALLVLVGLRRGAGETDDTGAAPLQRADQLGADPGGGAGDDGYPQARTTRDAAAFRPAASVSVAVTRCLPFASFVVSHARE